MRYQFVDVAAPGCEKQCLQTTQATTFESHLLTMGEETMRGIQLQGKAGICLQLTNQRYTILTRIKIGADNIFFFANKCLARLGTVKFSTLYGALKRADIGYGHDYTARGGVWIGMLRILKKIYLRYSRHYRK